MKKALRDKLVADFGAALAALKCGFDPASLDSKYLWAGEAVWQRHRGDVSEFVVLVPERKHGEDAFTVELAWSRHGRFPELVRRPWIVRTDQLVRAGAFEEGSVRLGFLAGHDVEWTPADAAARSQSIAHWMSLLQLRGLPFLESP